MTKTELAMDKLNAQLDEKLEEYKELVERTARAKAVANSAQKILDEYLDKLETKSDEIVEIQAELLVLEDELNAKA